jgi:cytochrome c oxidase cbb3-type subunit 2
MPAFADKLSDQDIKAISDYERSSWGHNAPEVPLETIIRLRDSILKLK